jgi:eukaryotic-like serine/threonine-protein kinase
MPPEQASAEHNKVTRRSDVYGLGAMLYHLLTGRPPFQAGTLNETLQQVVEKDPLTPRLLNPSVPRDLQTICLKCLEKEPERRYPTAIALAEELDRFLNGEPTIARPLSPIAKASP